jgi:AcrR family transcriptional regulator
MARTRLELDREEKVAEIVEAAERRLHKGGYPALSMVSIARELGLAQNALYWYFPSKDHLFIAALERTLQRIVASKPPRQGGIDRRVMWFVDRLAELDHVRSSMHERARVSPVVSDFVARMNAVWRRMLTNVLADRVPKPGLELAVDTLLATIQGVLSQDLGPARRRRIVGFALERLTTGDTARRK